MTSFMKEFEHLKIQLEEIKNATNSFGNQVIGKGGFGAVYKGEVSHSKGRNIVAIKRLNRQFGQGESEFLKEIVMLSHYTHQNLISLLGYCDESDEKILLYEYASNGSLNHHLGDPCLTWTQRLSICLGAAKGLSFLHDPNGTYQRVIHCDIKSANILLDENLNAKVADFGLSKMGPANQQYSFLVTNPLGTVGYCDPQYMTTYTLTKESDVYSFGVVLFEVLCGKLCVQFSNGKLTVSVPMWKKCYIEKKLDKIIFQDLLMQEMDPTSLETFSNIAFQCLHEFREERPTMSRVVEKLEVALESQKLHDLKLEKILEAAADPLVYGSIHELNVLLSKGQTWFSMNDKGQHCVLISIDQCFDSYYKDKDKDYSSRYSLDYNSRFKVGTYNTRGMTFGIRVSLSKFLSRGITYMVNLVFKCPNLLKQKTGKQQYIAITYQLKGEEDKRSSIVHVGDKREDEWLVAGLYQFNTSEIRSNIILELEIQFGNHYHCNGGLEIEGIEFQPLEDVGMGHDDQQVLLDQYKDILEAANTPLYYRSVQELVLLLSRGVLLNRGKTWFYLNDKGQHCEMISIADCLILDANEDPSWYFSNYNSRFPVGSLDNLHCDFRTRVRTQFLSPYITYTVNLVFRFYENCDIEKSAKHHPIGLKYKLNGEEKKLISYLANKREDNWWMLELCQFTSNGTNVDLEIRFEGAQEDILVDGIEFQPLEKDEQVLEYEIEKETDRQSLSDSDDTYWEQKLPNDYQDIIKLSKDGVRWTTKKELYSILFGTGFLINNGQESFFLDKNGKRCQMLSARVALLIDEEYRPYWLTLPESRFGEACVADYVSGLRLRSNITSQVVLSPQTRYACYLVYKLPAEDQSYVEGPVKVSHEDLSGYWYIYLVRPPETPVITPKSNQNTHIPVNRPNIKGIPQKRSDGWMEVQVWEFQTATTTEIIPMRLSLTETCDLRFDGFIMQGIEFRPL